MAEKWKGGDWNIVLISPEKEHLIRVIPTDSFREVEAKLVAALRAGKGIEIEDVRGELVSVPYWAWMQWIICWQKGGWDKFYYPDGTRRA